MIATLETPRLLLRPFVAGDHSALAALFAEESFWWYSMRRAATVEEAARFLERVMSAYDGPMPSLHAVVERASGALAGYAGLSVPTFLPEVLPAIEVGWRLGTAYRGQGYATEAGQAALEWGFQRLELERIISIYEPENRASGSVMDRLGFDEGYLTVHPTSGLPLKVRSLTTRSWSVRRGAA